VGSLSAKTALDVAQKLETMAPHGNWEQIKQTMASLETEIDHLRPALAALIDGPTN
jgi:hypothetical protein